MNVFHSIALWVEHLLGLAKAGVTIPPPPAVGGPSVSLPAIPAPAPVIAAPVGAPVGAPSQPTPASPAPSQAVTGVISEWTNGMSQPDARGFVKLQAIETQRVADPRWANVCAWYAIKDILTTFALTPAQHLNVEANMVECAVIANSALVGDHPFDVRELNTAYAMTAPTKPGATYTRGLPYNDALAFPTGFVDKSDPTVADLPLFIATCNSTGKYPVIDHTGVGAVA